MPYDPAHASPLPLLSRATLPAKNRGVFGARSHASVGGRTVSRREAAASPRGPDAHVLRRARPHATVPGDGSGAVAPPPTPGRAASAAGCSSGGGRGCSWPVCVPRQGPDEEDGDSARRWCACVRACVCAHGGRALARGRVGGAAIAEACMRGARPDADGGRAGLPTRTTASSVFLSSACPSSAGLAQSRRRRCPSPDREGDGVGEDGTCAGTGWAPLGDGAASCRASHLQTHQPSDALQPDLSASPLSSPFPFFSSPARHTPDKAWWRGSTTSRLLASLCLPAAWEPAGVFLGWAGAADPECGRGRERFRPEHHVGLEHHHCPPLPPLFLFPFFFSALVTASATQTTNARMRDAADRNDLTSTAAASRSKTGGDPSSAARLGRRTM
ncbi:hypothetical protein CDD83_2488 [Cordyceps sp. RAO-2017]|nr:hypothetical protein CDD83_2488 [Cordyceps sp. RAO-2017]